MQPDMEEQYDKIYRYCYFKLGNPQLAEDITQETFLRSLESERFCLGGRPLAFLYTVARNLCIDEYRKRKHDQLSEEVLEQKALEHAFSQEDRLIDSIELRRAFLELTSRERELVLLRYVNEVPVGELADLMGVSRFTVYREIRKILKKLERRISDEKKADHTTRAEGDL
ncbi:MAG: RNA polymerase sigma factor [Lachnospiraceae bacterium]|jgi:RNA polymerase sigma-70 factor (ECF subfamily)|nr:RNA polymerase sigma factor [Lachnospiraceae bacterium]